MTDNFRFDREISIWPKTGKKILLALSDRDIQTNESSLLLSDIT